MTEQTEPEGPTSAWEEGYAKGERDALLWAAQIVNDKARQGLGLASAEAELRRLAEEPTL